MWRKSCSHFTPSYVLSLCFRWVAFGALLGAADIEQARHLGGLCTFVFRNLHLLLIVKS